MARVNRAVALLGAAVVIGGSLAGCGGKVITAGDTTILISEFAENGMDAMGGGRLEVVGGCLGASGAVIVWPYGTEVVSEDPLTISLPGKGTFALGDDVQVAGGFLPERTSSSAEPNPYVVGGVTVPPACAEHELFLAH